MNKVWTYSFRKNIIRLRLKIKETSRYQNRLCTTFCQAKYLHKKTVNKLNTYFRTTIIMNRTKIAIKEHVSYINYQEMITILG